MSLLNHSITLPVCLFASLSFELPMWSEWCWLYLPWPYSVSPSFSHIFCLSARHNHNHLFLLSPRTHLYRGTWCGSMLTPLLANMNSHTIHKQKQYSAHNWLHIGITDKVSITAHCNMLSIRLELSSVALLITVWHLHIRWLCHLNWRPFKVPDYGSIDLGVNACKHVNMSTSWTSAYIEQWLR